MTGGSWLAKTMKTVVLFSAVLITVSVGTFVRAADTPKEPIITLEPFEPPYEECYKWDDKFGHPEEIIAPRFLYPYEMRRAAINGEVVVLVHTDLQGYPDRLSILYSTHIVFSRVAIAALKGAQWKPTPNRFGRLGVWFYYKAVYDVEKSDENTEGTKSPPSPTSSPLR